MRLKIGDSVYYYSNSVTIQPLMAIVSQIYTDDVISLAVWEAGRFVPKQSIQRRNSDAMKQNPNLANMQGTWEHRDMADRIVQREQQFIELQQVRETQEKEPKEKKTVIQKLMEEGINKNVPATT